MPSLNDIVQSAHGGDGVATLAQKFGLSPYQAQSVINAVLPAFERGLQNQSQSATGLGGLLGELTNGVHQQAFQNSASVGSGPVQQAGGTVVGNMFGNSAITTQIAEQASKVTGIPEATIQAMLPTLASIVMGGLFQAMHNGGFSGWLNQLPGAGGGTPGTGGSGWGGMLGGILNNPQLQSEIGGALGGLFGVPGSAAAPGSSGQGLEGGLSALINMFHAGTPATPSHLANLDSLLDRNAQT